MIDVPANIPTRRSKPERKRNKARSAFLSRPACWRLSWAWTFTVGHCFRWPLYRSVGDGGSVEGFQCVLRWWMGSELAGHGNQNTGQHGVGAFGVGGGQRWDTTRDININLRRLRQPAMHGEVQGRGQRVAIFFHANKHPKEISSCKLCPCSRFGQRATSPRATRQSSPCDQCPVKMVSELKTRCFPRFSTTAAPSSIRS